MTVLFHITSQRDWERAMRAGIYTAASLDGGVIAPPFHQVWARMAPWTPASADEFAADPTMLSFLLEQSGGDGWVFRRHPALTRSLDQVGIAGPDGVRFVRPEIALLYKAKSPRFKDERDFDRVLPHLDATGRAWLASSLDQAHPGHPWRARL